MGGVVALTFLLAACTYIAVRRKRGHDQRHSGMSATNKPADSEKSPWDGNRTWREAVPKQHSNLDARKAASLPLHEPVVSVNSMQSQRPAESRETASSAASEPVDSLRSPWARQSTGQQPIVDSAKSRHSQERAQEAANIDNSGIPAQPPATASQYMWEGHDSGQANTGKLAYSQRSPWESTKLPKVWLQHPILAHH